MVVVGFQKNRTDQPQVMVCIFFVLLTSVTIIVSSSISIFLLFIVYFHILSFLLSDWTQLFFCRFKSYSTTFCFLFSQWRCFIFLVSFDQIILKCKFFTHFISQRFFCLFFKHTLLLLLRRSFSSQSCFFGFVRF